MAQHGTAWHSMAQHGTASDVSHCKYSQLSILCLGFPRVTSLMQTFPPDQELSLVPLPPLSGLAIIKYFVHLFVGKRASDILTCCLQSVIVQLHCSHMQ